MLGAGSGSLTFQEGRGGAVVLTRGSGIWATSEWPTHSFGPQKEIWKKQGFQMFFSCFFFSVCVCVCVR